METYLQRTYGQKKQSGEQKSFPFWDYRSRRGSISTSASCSDGSSVSSMSSSRSDVESESVSLSGSDSDSLLQNDPTKLTIQFFADTHEVFPLLDLFQPIVGWIDSDLQLFKINERNSVTVREEALSKEVPSLAIIVFLHEEGMVGCERIQGARRHFDKPPWKFHHSEQLGGGKINPYPYNSQEFYYTSPDLPLWAVRQVHYGKEHIRLVVYTSDENWEDMLDFYKLILGADPELQRPDFCLFTIHAQIHYNVQFALKRLPAKISPKLLTSVTLQFKVTEVGHLVPLFPNICRPVHDNRWETTDHDGNSILLDVTGTSPNTSLDKSFSRLSTLDTSLDRSHGQMSLGSSSSSGVYSSSNGRPDRTYPALPRCSSSRENVYRHNEHCDIIHDRKRVSSNPCTTPSEGNDSGDIRTKLNHILQRPSPNGSCTNNRTHMATTGQGSYSNNRPSVPPKGQDLYTNKRPPMSPTDHTSYTDRSQASLIHTEEAQEKLTEPQGFYV